MKKTPLNPSIFHQSKAVSNSLSITPVEKEENRTAELFQENNASSGYERYHPRIQFKQAPRPDFFKSAGNDHGIREIIQPKWIDSKKEGAAHQWDALLDGVQWYADKDGMMWYEVAAKGSQDYSKWTGEGKKDSFEKWHQLRWAVFPGEYPEKNQLGQDVPAELYKGVRRSRLNMDLKETMLPTGIRMGSATASAVAQGRLPTKLDEITLWFGTKSTAESYCKTLGEFAVLLKIDVSGHPVLKSGNDFFSTSPMPWSKIKYLTDKDSWADLQGNERVPGNAKDMFESDDEEGWESD